MNAADLRAAILAASDLKTQDLPIAEWGVTVTLKSLTGKARDDMQVIVGNDKSVSNFEAALAVAAVVGDDGLPAFTSADVTALQDKSSAVITRIAKAVMAMNGMGPAATETAAKNSEADPSDSSPTA